MGSLKHRYVLPAVLVSFLCAGGDAATAGSNGECKLNALEKSKCVIEAVLEKIAQDYRMVGGGGITSIRFVSSRTVEAVMPQEGRADVWVFGFELDDAGKVIFTDIEKTTN